MSTQIAAGNNILINVQASGTSNIRNVNVDLKGLAGASKSAADSFVSLNAAVSLASQGFALYSRTLGKITTDADQFQLKIAQINNAVSVGATSFDSTAASLLKLSTELGRPVGDLAAAQFQIVASQATQGANSFNILRDSVNLAKVTFTSVESAARSLTGALNAFSLSENKSAQVSALLAQVNQKTGLSVDQVGAGFGKVGPLAESLGISIEEVTAAITTLGQKGLRGNEAIQALAVLLNRLANPSQETIRILASIGAESGQAAIAQKGLIGTLQALILATGGNVQELEKLSGGLRGTKGFLALAGDGAKLFEKNLEDANNAQERFSASIKGLSDTEGAAYFKALNALKTAFIDLGNSVEIFLGKNNRILTFLSGFTNFVGDVVRNTSSGVAISRDAAEALNKIIATKDEASKKIKERDATSTKAFVDDITRVQKAVIDGFGPLTKKAAEAVKASTENLKVASEATRLNITGTIDGINDRINDLKRIVSDARTIAENSAKFITDLKSNIRSSDAESRISVESNDRRKLALIKKEEQRVNREIQNAENEGTKEGQEKLKKLVEEHDKLLIKKRDINLELNKQRALQTQAPDINGKIEVNQTGIFNKSLREREAAATKAEESTKRQNEQAQKLVATAKQELIQQELKKKALETLVQEITKLSALDATGKIKKDFEQLNKEGIFDPKATKEKALQAFDEIRQRAISALKDSGADQKTIDQFKKIFNLEGQRKAYIEQIDQALFAKKIEAEKLLLTEKFNNLKKEAEFAQKLIDESTAKRKAAIEDIQKSLQLLRDPIATDQVKGNNANESLFFKNTLLPQIDAVSKARAALAADPGNAQKVKALGDAIAQLDVAIQKAQDSGYNLDETFKKLGINSRDVIRQLIEDFRRVKEAQSGIDQGKDKQIANREALETVQALAKAQKIDLSTPISAAADSAKLLATNSKSTADGFAESLSLLEEINIELNKIASKGKVDITVSSLGGKTENRFQGGLIEGYAAGGRVRDPRDTVAAYLSPGEYVVNADQTKRFLPLIEAINNGKINSARGFAQGGHVTTVGDIHISVQGGSPDQTVRDIGHKLRRELQRGNIRFE